MNCRIVLAAMMLATGVRPAAADWYRSDHVMVQYAGIDRSYAVAMTRIVERARATAIDRYGFDMPALIRVSVTINPKEKRRLSTDGRDRMFLVIRSKEDMQQPEQSGLFHIYGYCHEVGHMAMYRLAGGHLPWMTGDGCEGWAHYFGRRAVDVVRANEGADLWPDAYDYEDEGSKMLEEELSAAPEELDAASRGLFRGAGAWKRLVDIVGDRGVAPIFLAWGRTKYPPANPAPAAARALWLAGGGQRVAPWWQQAGPILVVNPAVRQPDGNGRRARQR
jgi:hypothetical protein